MPQMAPHMWIILTNLTLVMMITPLLSMKTKNKTTAQTQPMNLKTTKNKW